MRFIAGAQSDSEVNSARSQVAEDKDWGYTSDSELYGSENSRRSSGAGADAKVSPTNNGSWYMVSPLISRFQLDSCLMYY